MPPPSADGFGASVYLSNDDTMSLSSAQRVLWAIDRYQPIAPSQVRPHEMLNYFSFDTAPVEPDHDFSVVAQLAPSETEPGQVSLGLAVQGRPATLASRRNANLAFVIDRSGSMSAEGRMDYLKQGLRRSLKELKNGDIVHVTLFDTTACDLIQNFVVGRDSMDRLDAALARIKPLGSTNLNEGLQHGYQAVDRTYQPGYSNRVLLITDAIANTGVTDPTLMAMVARNYDERRVRLSGVGVGTDFNDSLLDELTERGKGAYVFLGSPAEVDAVFGPRFVSLIETVANDVHFKLSLPPSLALKTFHGEEASTQKERVQAVHYFAGTSQMFLSDLTTRDGRVPSEDDLMLTIEYQDPEHGSPRIEEFAWNIGQITASGGNLRKAQLIATFSEQLQHITALPVADYQPVRYGYHVQEASGRCADTQRQLESLAGPLRNDPEVRRVESLWSQFCSRYPVAAIKEPQPEPRQPRQPRNNDYAPKDSWPGARG
jgi:Ca-activated chloride channel family protein